MRFLVTATCTISMSTDVEAETVEEALTIAESRDLVSLHATWQDDPTVEWVTSGEIDGSLENMGAEASDA